MRRLQLVAVIVACTLAFVGCRSMTGRSFGQQWDDKTISTQVKAKLMTDRFNNLFSTGVGTQFGVVRLTGTVQSPEQKAEAERIAGRVAGVKGVKNEIVVVPRDQTLAARGSQGAGGTGGAAASASPGSARPVALTGEVTAIDTASGDVTLKTSAGDVVVRLPAATAQSLEQGQKLTINAGAK